MNTVVPIYNVRDYGAKGDGQTPDTSHIQAANKAASDAGGGVVLIPPGDYLLRSPGIVLLEHIILTGVGHGNYPANGDAGNGGSWFLIDQAGFVPISMRLRSQFKRVGISHQHNNVGTGWAPTVYDFAIRVGGDDCVIRDIFLLNSYDGIAVGDIGMNAGRVFIDRVYGQPFHQGIVIYNSQDVARINNVHFWVYWNSSLDVTKWTLGNGMGFVSCRNDNPDYVNCFAFQYDTGFRFEKTADGVTSKFHMVNCEADLCRIGIKIVSDNSRPGSRGWNHTGQICNWTSQASPTSPDYGGSIGLWITGTDSAHPEPSSWNHVSCSNTRLSLYHLNGVRVDGESNYLTFDGLWVDNWNIQGNGWPGVEVIKTSSSAYLGVGSRFTNGNGAHATGGQGTIGGEPPVVS